MKQETLTGLPLVVLTTALVSSLLVAASGYAYHPAEAIFGPAPPIRITRPVFTKPSLPVVALPVLSPSTWSPEETSEPDCVPGFIPPAHRHDPPLPPPGTNVWTPTRGWCFMTEEEQWSQHRPRDDVYTQPPYYSMSELMAAEAGAGYHADTSRIRYITIGGGQVAVAK